MLKIILLLVFLAFLSIYPVRAGGDFGASKVGGLIEVKKLDDERALILKSYLEKYDSPLQNHAQDFIDAADKYDLDWKLVPAIAGVESTFGKYTPGGYEQSSTSYERSSTSYNGWGWGVYGTQAIYFSSWRDGIFNVSEGLRENYADKGLKDPYQINRAYAVSPYWGSHVSYFLTDIESFAKNFKKQSGNQQTSNYINLKAKNVMESARLSFKN